MSEVGKVTAELRAIPKERLGAKIARSAFGLLFVAGAVLAAWKLNWSWFVVVPLAMFGAHIMSAELTKAGVRFVVAAVKDMLKTIRNGKNGASNP